MTRANPVRPALLLTLTGILAGVPAGAQSREEAKLAGTDVRVPKRTRFVAPAYPAEAMARGLRGIVIVELLIDGEGKVIGAEVIRSIPGLDEAALRAVRDWEYEPTRLEGGPVSVRLTVPIAFVPKLPELTRQEGIPELRQGALPVYPPGGDSGGEVTLDVTLDRVGAVAETSVVEGDEPWAEALQRAVRTWHFVTDAADRSTLSFRVEASFPPRGEGEEPPTPEIHLTGMRRSESMASGGGTPAAGAVASGTDPGEDAPPDPEHTPGATPPSGGAPVESAPNAGAGPALETDPAIAPPEEPEASEPVTQPAEPEPEPEPPAAPEPDVTQAEAEPGTLPVEAPPVAVAEGAGPGEAHEDPPVEVLRSPVAAPPAALQVPGYSSIEDVELDVGVPDLVDGRRPVVPPLARLQRVTGQVSVRFALNAAGESGVQEVEGPELLKPAARAAVESWSFRRTSPQRLYLVADIVYGEATALAKVRLRE